MPKIILFLLGEKGLSIALTLSNKKYADLIDLVVVGTDKDINNDFSEDIITLCNSLKINTILRSEFKFQLLIDSSQYLAICCGWRWIIPDVFKTLYIFHDSLLPKYRGFNPLVTALLNRDTLIGMTLIRAVPGRTYDTGDIVDQRSIEISYPILIGEAISLVAELYKLSVELLFIKILNSEPILTIPQDPIQASYSLWRDMEDYRINWDSCSDDIVHFINCVGAPYNGASTTINNTLVRILSAESFPDILIINRTPGKVIFIIEEKPIVVCSKGLLKINSVLFENGNTALPLKIFRSRFS